MKIALLTNSKFQFNSVWRKAQLEKLGELGELSPLCGRRNLAEHHEFLSKCELAVSTWGMPALTEQEIKEYLPCLKAVFYAAGTVKAFAEPFLKCGIKIFSAAEANAVPVAEYTLAQIILAAKGYFQSAKLYRPLLPLSFLAGRRNYGNYQVKIGLIGLGVIGSMLCIKLKDALDDAKIYAYDPFVSKERAQELGAELVSVETLFSECDVISNHLADKPSLKNFFNKNLFSLMKKNATFINTGRGAQVNEYALAWALLSAPARTAVLDVIKSEYFPILSPLWWCPNAILTPHIAGSTGGETVRMAEYMLEVCKQYLNGESPSCEITLEKLIVTA